jgi:SAM-dependent methyltransferase
MTASVDPNWFEDFFDGVVVDFWIAATEGEGTDQEVEFLAAELQLPEGGRVMDVPCGHGRHAVAMSGLGFRVCGVDLSTEFLARGRAAGSGDVEWVRRDMRDLQFEAQFDGAYCMGNSFGYLDRAGDRAFLGGVSRSLRPGGRFVLDTGIIAESLLPNFEENSWMRRGDITFLFEHHYLAEESCLRTDYTFVRGAESVARSSLHQVYTVAELRNMCAEVGMETVGSYSSPGREPFELREPRLLLVSEKRS